MILKEAETVAEVEKIIETDPVRKHIDAEWRLGNGARVFYFGDIDNVKAAICMHTSRIVPDSEEELLEEYDEKSLDDIMDKTEVIEFKHYTDIMNDEWCYRYIVRNY